MHRPSSIRKNLQKDGSWSVHVWLHSHKFITNEFGKTSLLEFLGKLSTTSSFFSVWENHSRLWRNLEIKTESQLSWTMVTLCNDQIKERWHESLNIRGQHLQNDIRNNEIYDSERIINLIPLEDLRWIIFSIISEWDRKTNAVILNWNPISIRSIRRESMG